MPCERYKPEDKKKARTCFNCRYLMVCCETKYPKVPVKGRDGIWRNR